MTLLRRLEHELGIKGHEKECEQCTAPKPIATLTGYAVLVDSQEREVSTRARVTCEVQLPKATVTGMTVGIRIKEAPVTLYPIEVNVSVRAVVVFDGGGDIPIGRSDRFHMISHGDRFTITEDASAAA